MSAGSARRPIASQRPRRRRGLVAVAIVAAVSVSSILALAITGDGSERTTHDDGTEARPLTPGGPTPVRLDTIAAFGAAADEHTVRVEADRDGITLHLGDTALRVTSDAVSVAVLADDAVWAQPADLDDGSAELLVWRTAGAAPERVTLSAQAVKDSAFGPFARPPGTQTQDPPSDTRWPQMTSTAVDRRPTRSEDPPAIRFTLHDVASVDGWSTLLYDLAPIGCGEEAGMIDITCRRRLMAHQPATGMTLPLSGRTASSGDWTSVSLAENGLIVGTWQTATGQTAMETFTITAARRVPTDFGWRVGGDARSDRPCSCRSGYTIDRGGRYVAWVDGTEIVVAARAEEKLLARVEVDVPMGSGIVDLQIDGIVFARDALSAGTAVVTTPDDVALAVERSIVAYDLATGEADVIDADHIRLG